MTKFKQSVQRQLGGDRGSLLYVGDIAGTYYEGLREVTTYDAITFNRGYDSADDNFIFYLYESRAEEADIMLDYFQFTR